MHVFRARGSWSAIGGARVHAGAPVTLQSSRLGLLADGLPGDAALLDRLLRIAQLRLAEQHDNGEFVFTVTGEAVTDQHGPGGGWRLRRAGTSLRYGAITALGLLRLPEPDQRTVLAGMTADDLVGQLAKRIDEISGLGDAALVCWAAAECGHADLAHALQRLAALDRPERPVDVVSAAWVVSALAAARPLADVERHLAAARQRLLAARGPAVYPHTTGPARPWYRAHVGSFADQVYPHPGAGPAARAARTTRRRWPPPSAVAAGDLLGPGRRRPVVVALRRADRRGRGGLPGLQRAPARDGADGPARPGRRRRRRSPRTRSGAGLRWLAGPPEGRSAAGPAGPRRAADHLAQGGARRPAQGRPRAAGRVHQDRPRGRGSRRWTGSIRPGVVDHECRPYELGWMLYAWLS